LFTVFGAFLQDKMLEQVVEGIWIQLLPGDNHGFIFSDARVDIVCVSPAIARDLCGQKRECLCYLLNSAASPVISIST
jgi:hypothetical protein